MTPEQEKIVNIFNTAWTNRNWQEVNETEKQLSYITVEDLLRPFTI